MNNKELTIVSSKGMSDFHTIRFYGIDGNVLRSNPSYPNADSVSLGSRTGSGTFTTKVIVPQGAVKMAISSTWADNSIKEITVSN